MEEIDLQPFLVALKAPRFGSRDALPLLACPAPTPRPSRPRQTTATPADSRPALPAILPPKAQHLTVFRMRVRIVRKFNVQARHGGGRKSGGRGVLTSSCRAWKTRANQRGR